MKPWLRVVMAVACLWWGAAANAAPFAYSVQSDVNNNLYRIDLATGIATLVGDTGVVDLEALTWGANGVLYAVSDSLRNLYTVNPNTGLATLVGPFGITTGSDVGLASCEDGTMWLSSEVGPNLYQINPATGAATLVAATSLGVTGMGCRNNVLWGITGNTANSLVIVNRATAALTVIGPLGLPAFDDGGADFDSAGNLWGINDGAVSQVFLVNLGTGAATGAKNVTIGGVAAGGFEGMAVQPTPAAAIQVPVLPAPLLAALALLLLAAGLLAARTRR